MHLAAFIRDNEGKQPRQARPVDKGLDEKADRDSRVAWVHDDQLRAALPDLEHVRVREPAVRLAQRRHVVLQLVHEGAAPKQSTQ